jgi:gliding motility-associated-like protein
MRKFQLLLSILLPAITTLSYAQDYSNKGKDFWLGYGYHVSMVSNGVPLTTGGSQDMVLYFTSDKNANVTVTIPGIAYTQTYTVVANQVTVSSPLPKTGTQDARIVSAGTFNRGIHITSDVPIVAYAHIYNASISGASLLFPTNTLGKDYYSVNYTQSSNANYANSFFFVVATEDNTTVEITPSAANLNGIVPGTPFTVTLNQGQVYNVMGTTSGNQGSDLTGSRIRSISANGSGGCKKIAVFSGSGKISIGGSALGTADNLFAQAFPAVAWGKHYLTAPTGSQPNNFYRICVKDPATVVKLNGVALPQSSLINGFYYQFKNSNQSGTNSPAPNLIESDQPILVAQYCTTQGADGNPGTSPGGDPEMIYLSPVEQTINKITLYSATRYLILQSFINVIIRKEGVTSFTLDGVSMSSSFQPHPQDPNYSYAIMPVGSGSHTLYSDTGFNAIAYGFGQAESYGYNAGTNVKDFSQVASFRNPYKVVDSAVTCVNTPFQFSVPFNFQPNSIKWDFSAAPNISPNIVNGPIASPQADSTVRINGQQVYYYSTRQNYTFSNANTPALRDTIKVYTTSTTPDGCGSTDQVYSIPVNVNGLPVAQFATIQSGCVSDSVYIADRSSSASNNITRWLWDFGDGTTADNSTGALSPKKYTNPTSYTIKLKTVSGIGCSSTETSQVVNLSSKPVANFTYPAVTCVNNAITYTDASSVQTGTITQWIWNLDNGAGPATISSNASQTTTYANFGTKAVNLQVATSTGCKSNVYAPATPVNIHAFPVPGFIVPQICLTDASAQFIDTSKVADGTSAGFTYAWQFNAGTPPVNPGPNTLTSTVQNPIVHYNYYGNYKVGLSVTSNGCTASTLQSFIVNGSNPVASFVVSNGNALCSNRMVEITNTSYVDFGGLTFLEIYWDQNDPTQKTIDSTPVPNKKYTHLYPDFQSPATKNFTITLRAYSGATSSSCKNEVAQTITVNASPKVSLTTLPGICFDAGARLITQASYNTSVTNAAGSPVFSGTGITNVTTGLFDPKAAGAGTYAIQYLAVSDKGCRDSARKNITVWPSPVARWSLSNLLCEKNAISFTDSSVANYSNIIQRKWDFGNGTTSIKTNNAAFGVTYVNAQTYTIGLQVLTDSGCTSTVSTQSVKVNPLPRPAFAMPKICLPDGNGQFTDQSSIADGSQALFSYLWNFGDPLNNTAAVIRNPTHHYSAVGPYNVQLKLTSKDGCTDSLTQFMNTVYPQPKAAFTAAPSEVCIGDTIHFTDKGNGLTSAAASWNWNLSGGAGSVLQNPLKRFTDSGTFSISYYFFNGEGCVSDTVTTQVIVDPYPVLKLPSKINVLEGGTVVLRPLLVYGTNLQYLWTPATYLSNNTDSIPRTTPQADITYKLTLTGKGGCSVTDTTFIKVLLTIDVPNVFSPNGDGINDTWKIKYLESYPGATVEVFDRYGQVVFKSQGYNKEWDGTYNGNPLPVATYYYVINPKNGRKIITGSVTIIK